MVLLHRAPLMRYRPHSGCLNEHKWNRREQLSFYPQLLLSFHSVQPLDSGLRQLLDLWRRAYG